MVNRLVQIVGAGLSRNPTEIISEYLVRMIKDNEEFESLTESLENERTKQAEAFIRERLFEYPDCVWGNLAAANIELSKDNTSRAFRHLEKVCRKEPANAVARYSCGYCCERMGLAEQAITCYKDAHKYKPYWQLPLKRIAAIYFRRRRLEDCIEQYRKLESIDPDNIATALINGYLHIAAGAFKNAGYILENAIISGPRQQVQDDTSEQRLLREGQFRQAIDNITQKLKETPDQPELLYKRAQIYNNLQESETAVQDYQSALRICPHYIEAAIQLAGIYSQAGKFIEAGRLYYKALAINSQFIELYIALSRTNLALDGKKKACETLSLAGSLVPNNRILLRAAVKNHFLAYESLNNTQHEGTDFQKLFASFMNKLTDEAKSGDCDPFTGYLLFLLNDPENSGSKELDEQLARIIKRSGFAPACDLLAARLCEKGACSAAFKLLPSGNLPTGKALGKYYQTAVLYSNSRLYSAAREQLKSRLNNAVPSAVIDKYLTLAIFNLGMVSLDSILFRTADTIIERTEQTIHSQ